MKLYAVRHGQTDENVKGILQGNTTDSPLTEAGVTQVEELASRVPEHIDAIYTSPRKRTIQSAEILNKKLKTEIFLREELLERDFGLLTGQSFKMMENGAQLREIDENQEYDYRPYGGESADDVAKRVKRFLNEIRTGDHDQILIVSSRGTIRMIYKLLGKTMQDVPTGSLHTFEL